MEETIEVKIDVFEHTAQRARLRTTMTVAALVEEIFKEFDDLAPDAPGKYALYLKGNDHPLPAGATLTQLDIQPQDELVFNYMKQSKRQMLDPRNYATLRDDASGRVYEIQWQPALIGRPTNEAEHNLMLAVNLQTHPQGHTISRAHGRITFSQGSFFIENQAGNNPLSVNGRLVMPGTRRELKNGDRILLGRAYLSMTFSTQPHIQPAAPAAAAARVQPAAPPAVQAVPPAEKGGMETMTTPPVPKRPNPAAQPAVGGAVIPSNVPSAATPGASLGSGAQSVGLVIERAIGAGKLGQRLDVPATPFLLGRDLPLLAGEGQISRRHAEINFDPRVNQYTLTDLRSTNGVTLNGVQIEPNRPYTLSQGTKIGLGAIFLMRFEL